MSCPYFAQVTMLFCQASPVKKLIPSDRVSSASPCEAEEHYRNCPLYREALSRATHEIEELETEPSERRKGELP